MTKRIKRDVIVAIYSIKNIKNSKQYIGSTVNFYARVVSHKYQLKTGKHKNQHLQRSWDKHGKDAFEFSLIEIVSDKCKLHDIELQYILRNNTFDSAFGYNLATPKRTATMNQKTRHSISCSIAQTNRYKDPKEREKTSISSKKAITQEIRDTISARMSEYWSHPENIKKQQIAANKMCTPERNDKIRQAHLARFKIKENVFNQIINTPHRKRVLLINTGVIYQSIRDAAKCLSISVGTVKHGLSGKHPSKFGYIFKIISEHSEATTADTYGEYRYNSDNTKEYRTHCNLCGDYINFKEKSDILNVCDLCATDNTHADRQISKARRAYIDSK